MATYEIKDKGNILKYAVPGSYVVMAVTVADTGISANSDGRKIIKAGTALESDSTGTIRADGDSAKKAGTGADVEGLLFTEVDVTDGDVTGAMLIKGVVDGSKLQSMPTGSAAALKTFGVNIIGTYTEA